MSAKKNRFISPTDDFWIFGTGTFGRAVAKAAVKEGYTPVGFLQTSPTATHVDGLPVRAFTGLKPNEKRLPTFIGVFNREMPLNEIVADLSEAGIEKILLPWDIYAVFGENLGWKYWLASPSSLDSHTKDIARTRDRLADDASLVCFDRCVAFRKGTDLAYGAYTHSDPQYFNDLTLTSQKTAPIRIVDGGAFDGDSLRKLSARTPIAVAYAFEPDPENYAELVASTRELKLSALCLPVALGETYHVERFTASKGEAARVDPTGETGIAVVSIDEVLAGSPVDFIKLDIEGAEGSALKGAAQTIVESRPILALSLYHKPEDLWVLPDLISQLAPRYKFYLRQHGYNSFDLVLYCIPTR